MRAEARHLRKLPETESISLLASTSFGRLVFSRHALPAIRPVSHVVDAGAVIVRTHPR
ncbi:pyridoxamine 5'-phosphate oxidase family protein [Lentzea sp. NPDC051838]|uniref:pyridoxamine 5'-phosphate oxidase family protein n=1 Tax=Lentzea sp. NPDC051838 TaxID=3154849 RepID=UPI0034365A0B